MKRCCALTVLLGLTLPLAGQSPWVKKPGGYYLQAGFNIIPAARELFSVDYPSYVLNRDVLDATVQLYGEYGLTDRLTALLEVPYKMVSTAEEVNPGGLFKDEVLPAGSLQGLGNINLGLKIGFKTTFPLAATIKIAGPTARSDRNTGLQTGYDGWAVASSISAGQSWKRVYAFAAAGVTVPKPGYSPDWFGQAEAGYRLSKLYVIGVLDLRRSFGGGDRPDGTELQTGLYANNQSYLAYGLKVSLALTSRFGINLSGYGAAAGNLVQKSPSFGGSFYFKT